VEGFTRRDQPAGVGAVLLSGDDDRL